MSTLEDYTNCQTHLFYVDWPWPEHKQEIQDMIVPYFHSGVVGYELSTNKVPHLQCHVEGTQAKYNSFIAKWKKRYHDRVGQMPVGRATKGLRRNYGKVKEIKKEPKYGIAYCMKDENYHFWGYKQSLIDVCKSISYKRCTSTQRQKLDEVLRWCQDHREQFDSENKTERFTFYVGLGEIHRKLFNNPLTRTGISRYLVTSGIQSDYQYMENLLNGHY